MSVYVYRSVTGRETVAWSDVKWRETVSRYATPFHVITWNDTSLQGSNTFKVRCKCHVNNHSPLTRHLLSDDRLAPSHHSPDTWYRPMVDRHHLTTHLIPTVRRTPTTSHHTSSLHLVSLVWQMMQHRWPCCAKFCLSSLLLCFVLTLLSFVMARQGYLSSRAMFYSLSFTLTTSTSLSFS